MKRFQKNYGALVACFATVAEELLKRQLTSLSYFSMGKSKSYDKFHTDSVKVSLKCLSNICYIPRSWGNTGCSKNRGTQGTVRTRGQSTGNTFIIKTSCYRDWHNSVLYGTCSTSCLWNSKIARGTISWHRLHVLSVCSEIRKWFAFSSSGASERLPILGFIYKYWGDLSTSIVPF